MSVRQPACVELFRKMSLAIRTPVAAYCITNSMRLVEGITARLFDPAKYLLSHILFYDTYLLGSLDEVFFNFRHERCLFLADRFSQVVRFLKREAS